MISHSAAKPLVRCAVQRLCRGHGLGVRLVQEQVPDPQAGLRHAIKAGRRNVVPQRQPRKDDRCVRAVRGRIHLGGRRPGHRDHRDRARVVGVGRIRLGIRSELAPRRRGSLTRQCTGPCRRVRCLWFVRRTCAGPACPTLSRSRSNSLTAAGEVARVDGFCLTGNSHHWLGRDYVPFRMDPPTSATKKAVHYTAT